MKAIDNFWAWMNEQEVPEQIVNDLTNEASKHDHASTQGLCDNYAFGLINQIELCARLCDIIER